MIKIKMKDKIVKQLADLYALPSWEDEDLEPVVFSHVRCSRCQTLVPVSHSFTVNLGERDAPAYYLTCGHTAITLPA